MLARLQEKEEVLLLGWGVKMPIPVRSRRYDEQFYNDIKNKKQDTGLELTADYSAHDANLDIFGDDGYD